MTRTALPEPARSFDSDLAALLDDQHGFDAGALSSFVLEQSRPESVGRIIDAVCSDDALAARCFRASVTHPLGFDKYMLLASARYQLRLHIWWPELRRGREDIHNHRFSFVSGMVTGKLQVSTYEIGKKGAMMQRFKEVRNPASGDYRYEPDQEVCIRQTNMLTLEANSGYYMDSAVLHRVDVPAGMLAATLFLRIGDDRKSTSVVVDCSSSAPVSGVRHALGADDARRRLRRFAGM
jgi:hypothetical protein